MSIAPEQSRSLLFRQVAVNRTALASGAAVLLPVLTLLLRLAFWDHLPGYPFLAFVPSVAFVALIGGVVPGISTACVSAMLGLAFLAQRPGAVSEARLLWTGFLLYVLVCAILIVLARGTARSTALAVEAASAQAAAREAALKARLTEAEAATERGQAARQLEMLTDALPVLISQISHDGRYQFVNRAYEEWFGRSREDLKGRRLEEVLGPAVLTNIKPYIDNVLSGQPVSFEQSVDYPSKGLREVRTDYIPNLGAKGEVIGFFTLVQDITEAKQHAELLAQREYHLRAVMESVTDCFYAVDPDWRITLFNRAAERYYGITRDEVLGRKLWEVFPAHLGSVFEQQLQRVMDDREPVTFEAQSVIFPGRYIEMRVSPKISGGIAVSFSNITERKHAERQRELLVRELNHRVKNTLAVVQSIAAKTFTGFSDPRASRQAFEGRLMALAAAHDLLTAESWEAADLNHLIRMTLRPFAAEGRVEVSGPDLRVRPQAAVTLSLGLHELATNGAKYGALSNATGRVSIRWTVSRGDTPVLRLVWQEQGGPEVIPPARAGFGSRLIKQGLSGELDGSVSISYAPEGLVCSIEAPLANLQVE